MTTPSEELSKQINGLNLLASYTEKLLFSGASVFAEALRDAAGRLEKIAASLSVYDAKINNPEDVKDIIAGIIAVSGLEAIFREIYAKLIKTGLYDNFPQANTVGGSLIKEFAILAGSGLLGSAAVETMHDVLAENNIELGPGLAAVPPWDPNFPLVQDHIELVDDASSVVIDKTLGLPLTSFPGKIANISITSVSIDLSRAFLEAATAKFGVPDVNTQSWFDSSFEGAGLGVVETQQLGNIVTIKSTNMDNVDGTLTTELKDKLKLLGQAITVGVPGTDYNLLSEIGLQGDTSAVENIRNIYLLRTGGSSGVIQGDENNDLIVATKDGLELIRAGAGDDLVVSTKGARTIFGGEGNDVMFGGDGNEKFYGGLGNDVMLGGKGSDTYFAGSEADEITGKGNDIFHGGDEKFTVDTADYTGAIGGLITYTLHSGTQQQREAGAIFVTNDGFGGRDVLLSVERIINTEGKEIFKVDSFDTGQLDDLLLFDGGGNDDAWDQGDALDFSGFGEAIKVDFSNSSEQSTGTLIGSSGNDVLKTGQIEEVIGTQFDDELIGGGAWSVLNGGAGNDTITGGDGADWILPGSGSNLIRGGKGEDWFWFDNIQSGDINVILDAEASDHLVWKGLELQGGVFGGEAGLDWDNTVVVLFLHNDVVGTNISLPQSDFRPTDLSTLRTWTYTVDGEGLTVLSFNSAVAVEDNESIVNFDPDDSNSIEIYHSTGKMTYDVVDNGHWVDWGCYGNPNRGYGSFFRPDDAEDFGGFVSMERIDTPTTTPSGDGGGGDDGGVGTAVAAVAGFAALSGATITESDPLPRLDGTTNDDLLLGTTGDEEIYAGVGNDIVLAGRGDDVIIGGSGQGDDLYDGEDGSDTVVYESALNQVIVDLAIGTATGTEIGTDSLISIENVIGGAGNDVIIGNALDNLIEAGGGNDELASGEGNDHVDGGDGTDIAVLSGSSADYSYRLTSDGMLVATGVNADADAGEDRYSNIETFRFVSIGGSVDLSFADLAALAAPNTLPVATADTGVAVYEDASITILASDLLSNDSDPDGDPLTIMSVQAALNGSVRVNRDGNIVFAPNNDFNGLAEFSYTISDGYGGTATATVSVVVNATNDAPIAFADGPLTTTNDAVLIIAAAALLGNDSDIDGDVLAIASVQDAVGGSAVMSAGGDVLFTPEAGFVGSASFNYTIDDGQGGAIHRWRDDRCVQAAESRHRHPGWIR